MAKLIIGGDICPTETNYSLFERADTEALMGRELISIFQSADYIFLNLEVALTNTDTAIRKAGPNLKAPTACIKGVKAINPYLYGLANNHILDYGQEGLQSTIQSLSKASISYTGIGNNLLDANKGYVAQVRDKKVGFYCCTEHEFTLATDKTPGANPFDPLYSLDTIEQLKENCDYCIVLYHGGKEFYRYPSPRLQKICRKIADKGADLVICQHSHCVGCKEEWKGTTIVYGQGNFLFDRGDDEFWNTSLLIEVSLLNRRPTVKFLPLVKKKNGVRLDIENREKILDGFYTRSKKILDTDFVQKEYARFADELGNKIIYSLLYKENLIERGLNKLSGYKRSENYKWNNNFALLNYMECESWNELLVTAMREQLKQ